MGNKKKILIFGGSGYIGGSLTDLLIENGYEFTSVDNLMYEQHYLKPIDLKVLDINKEKNKEYFKNIFDNYDVVVNLSSLVGDGACSINPDLTIETNLNFVKWLSENFKGKIVQMSTCHDDKTRCWTSNGLKKYEDINLKDKVLTINLLNKKTELKSIKKIVVKDYIGDLIKYKGKRFSLNVTQDHNMVYQDIDDNIIYERAYNHKKIKSRFLNSSGFSGDNDTSNIPNIFKEWDIRDLFYLTGLYVGDGYNKHSSRITKNKSGLNRKDFLKMCRNKKGQFISERLGQEKDVICNGFGVNFCLPVKSKNNTRQKLIKIFDKYNLKYWQNKREIGISGSDYYYFFCQFGYRAHNKTIPNWVLNFDKDYLKWLFQGLAESDGNHSKYKNFGDHLNYTTVSKHLALQKLPELASKLGYFYGFFTRKSESHIKGRKISCKLCYSCLFSTQVMWCKPHHAKENYYNGKVWCLEVEDNHNFLIERDGRFTFSGNCSTYGLSDETLDENGKTNPLSLYASTKLEGEPYILNKSGVVFRLGTVFGKGDNFSRIRLDLVSNVLSMKAALSIPLSIFSGGQWRPLISVRDVARAILYAIENDLSGLYNVSYGNFTIKDIAETVKEVVANCKVEYTEMKFEDLRNYRVNCDKLYSTGFKPIYTLKNGVEEMVRLFQEKRIKNPFNPLYSNVEFLKDRI